MQVEPTGPETRQPSALWLAIDEETRARWWQQKVRVKQQPPDQRGDKEDDVDDGIYPGQSVIRYRGKRHRPAHGIVKAVLGNKGTIIMVYVGGETLVRCRLNKFTSSSRNNKKSYGTQHKVKGRWCYREEDAKTRRKWDSWVLASSSACC
jgi:hypothetical protein